jgi:hypothetical protein
MRARVSERIDELFKRIKIAEMRGGQTIPCGGARARLRHFSVCLRLNRRQCLTQAVRPEVPRTRFTNILAVIISLMGLYILSYLLSGKVIYKISENQSVFKRCLEIFLFLL